MTSPTLFLLLDTEALSGVAALGEAGQSPGPEALARALATSPAWATLPEAALIARPAPHPAVAVLGRFDEAEAQRLKALRGQLSATLEHLRYVSYAQAERDCEQLAQRFLDRFGREEVRRFRFVGLPRGGLIVLGMLSYALDLEHGSLAPPPSPETPLVVVDDCALTGARFKHFLEDSEHRRLLFAPLYAHPDLRAAVSEEPRVEACLSACDLHDHGPERLGDAYPAWKERWAQRANGSRYWIGQPDHVCFPWNEPDVGVWNPASETVEHGWHVVPPAHCLKNRRTPGSALAVPVQVQPEGEGPLAPPAHVLFGTFEEQLVVANVAEKTSFCLTGGGAAMWRALVEHGTINDALATLQSVYDEVDPATLAADLRAFTADLRARDLLEERDHARPTS